MGLADVGKKQAQVIVNLGRGGDDGARIGARPALLDGDGRRKPLDEIHIRLFHLIQKLPRVSRERLDIFALALGVNGVKGQRRFARTAQPGDDDQFVARDGEAEVLQIMLARAANPDEFLGHDIEFCNQSIPPAYPDSRQMPSPRSVPDTFSLLIIIVIPILII